ncbi:MucB/RseB C-terminal domain-containing protein [Sideroxydans lithotrophicus]|uniref:Sigma E regulatory protein, MucB/RseB n=1 Tax=Sideroxydans lithotrophicus (strain ES-1) TaxID=580332 RepID=D5CRC7_SIDLE|nr:MucB/RseB C-terminal domain-containing protein [Sideroxydans lithotrophicus]ADE11513.1 sigma E regulatory protein, MucB/RseB [Sideroxydans lithotrophicus ES-1]
MRQYSYLFFMLLQLGVASAFADPLRADESDWLKTMAFAAHQTDYSGVFVYQSGGRVEMSRITHVSDSAGEHERLEGIGGERRELIRDNDQVWLYTDGHKVRVEKRQIKRSFPALLPEQISLLKENYSVTQAEEDEVAGYHAHAVVFLPRDNLRYARKLWADSDSGLLLKAVVLNDRGLVIEQYAFMQLNIGGNIDRKWIVQDKPSAAMVQELHLSPLPKVELLEEPCGWQVDALPSGFKKILEMRRPFRANKEHVIQMVFSDGLAGISVFIEKSQDASYLHSGLSGQGAVHIYNRIVGDHLITVVGEVPSRTVIQVGDSVRYAGQ